MRSCIPVAVTGDIDDGLEDLDGCLRPLVELLASTQTRMTFPVTATAIRHFPRKIEYLIDRGHEIAGHGDVHDAFVGPVEKQTLRLRLMLEEFRRCLGIVPVGFRAPYLAHDSNLYLALAKAGLRYDSSCVSKDPLLYLRYTLSRQGSMYRASVRTTAQTLKMYVGGACTPKPFEIVRNVVELPVFEFDDWFFFEAPNGPRLEAAHEMIAAEIWTSSLKHFGLGNNLFVIQAHPKRMSPHRLRILENFIDWAKGNGHPLVTLAEVLERGLRA